VWIASAAGLVSALDVVAVAQRATPAPGPRDLSARARPADPLPPALESMVDTERRFAARAGVIGWKAAFLEFFADGALGFENGAVGFAKEQIGGQPDPPPDFQLLWEPRWGDVSASGDLGYLTGPSRSILPSRDGGRPRHSVYASVWKRQRDGTFQVVMDVGVPIPGPSSFAPGFTRAPHDSRFTGDYDERTPPLATADGVLNSDLRTSQARAYRGRLAPGARLHRPGIQPVVGDARIATFLRTQPSLLAADTRSAESSQAGDLGYTWGTYRHRLGRGARARGGAQARGSQALPGAARGAAPAGQAEAGPEVQEGFYVRVWVRERAGQWRVALDVLQPQ
jgi:hypothetical protein